MPDSDWPAEPPAEAPPEYDTALEAMNAVAPPPEEVADDE